MSFAGRCVWAFDQSLSILLRFMIEAASADPIDEFSQAELDQWRSSAAIGSDVGLPLGEHVPVAAPAAAERAELVAGGDRLAVDEDGQELSDLDAVQHETRLVVAILARDVLGKARCPRGRK